MISNDRLIPGDIKLVDINEDGEINPNDKVILSSENPKYTFAFNLGARWKMFDLNLFFQGAAGVSRYFTMNSMVNLTVTLVTLQITG